MSNKHKEASQLMVLHVLTADLWARQVILDRMLKTTGEANRRLQHAFNYIQNTRWARLYNVAAKGVYHPLRGYYI